MTRITLVSVLILIASCSAQKTLFDGCGSNCVRCIETLPNATSIWDKTAYEGQNTPVSVLGQKLDLNRQCMRCVDSSPAPSKSNSTLFDCSGASINGCILHSYDGTAKKSICNRCQDYFFPTLVSITTVEVTCTAFTKDYTKCRRGDFNGGCAVCESGYTTITTSKNKIPDAKVNACVEFPSTEKKVDNCDVHNINTDTTIGVATPTKTVSCIKCNKGYLLDKALNTCSTPSKEVQRTYDVCFNAVGYEITNGVEFCGDLCNFENNFRARSAVFLPNILNQKSVCKKKTNVVLIVIIILVVVLIIVAVVLLILRKKKLERENELKGSMISHN
jgi:hypothetical protein